MFNMFKSKQKRVEEAVHRDLSYWKMMCSAIVTLPGTFFPAAGVNLYPLKDEYKNIHALKTWMFAAFVSILRVVVGHEDMRLLNIYGYILHVIETDDNNHVDKNAGEPIAPKIENLLDWWGDIADSLNGRMEYTKSVMNRIESHEIELVATWEFCKRFIKMVTKDDTTINLDVGADFMFNRFIEIIKASKTFDVYESCYKN